MFTIEMDMEETTITMIDPEGSYEDIEIFMYEDIVYIRQWNEDLNKFMVIASSPTQFMQLMYAFKLPEGAYVLNIGEKK